MRIVQAGYGDAGPLLLQSLLSRPLFAHLATTCPDGPRESPVWFLWDEPVLWFIAIKDDGFGKRIAADPRCAIGIVDFDSATGRVQHAGMRGSASIEPWNPDRARALLSRYLGADETRWDTRFRATINDFSNIWIRFAPSTAVIRDQSYEVRR